MAETHRYEQDQLRREAGEWFVIMNDENVSEEDEREFKRWLARGALHRATYNRIAGLHSAGKRVDWENLPPPKPVRGTAKRVWITVIGCMALTLLNGHRLSFGGSAQGIDISGIPTEAIERVEIIPDGSSALYGSDAVAGVVNVILRRSFDGVTANARVGTATDGGGTSQLYQIVAGKQWQSGNLLVAYGFRRNEEVDAEDRDYTNYLPEPYPLIKGQRVHSALVSGSQSLFDDVRFSLDATFVDRAMDGSYNTNNILSVSHTTDRSLSISPSLTIPVDDNWSLSVASTYARSRNRRQTASSSNGTVFLREDFCYCHSLHAVEAYLEGSALSLPAGDVRAVLGAGYRKNRYRVHGRSSANGDQFVTTGGDQSDTYAFGEIQIPVISGLNETAFAKALTISVAGRYDRYNYSGSVTTPKIGLIYSPNNAVDLKFSWGRSFKAPTLASIYQTQYAYLLPLTYFGRSDAAPDESALYLDGGSTSLRPERATTWTATVAFHPKSLPGLNADLRQTRAALLCRPTEDIWQSSFDRRTPSPTATAKPC